MNYYAIGLMTGSSMDGVDAALLCTDGKQYIERLGGVALPFSSELKRDLQKAQSLVTQAQGEGKAADHTLAHSSDADFLKNVVHDLTIIHIQAIEQLLKKTGYREEAISIIGMHGQNLYHRPERGVTIQVGDAHQLAQRFPHSAVVHRFREADVQHGGRGAPFAPLYHQAITASKNTLPLAVVNCGGIANVTFINGSEPEDLVGFDVGPGNALIDQWVQYRTDKREWMDRDGVYGLKGKVHSQCLDQLKTVALLDSEDFFERPAPKALDASQFRHTAEYLSSLSLEDGCATLEAFTAWGIVKSLDAVAFPMGPPKHWLLAGGGWHNPVITRELECCLRQRLGDDVCVARAESWGLSAQWMEAEMFAYYAVRSLQRLPISFPNTTGVSKPMSGGVVIKGAQCALAMSGLID